MHKIFKINKRKTHQKMLNECNLFQTILLTFHALNIDISIKEKKKVKILFWLINLKFHSK